MQSSAVPPPKTTASGAASEARFAAVVARWAPIVPAAGAALLPYVATSRDALRPAGYPLLDLRPYVGLGAPAATESAVFVRCAVMGAVAAVATWALMRAIPRGRFAPNAAAAVLAVSALLFAPAWCGALRFDLGSLGDPSAASASDAGVGGRLRTGLLDFVAAPARAFSPDPRFDVPTGTATAADSDDVVRGAAVHALLFAVGAMLAGRRRAVVALVGGCATSLGLALFVPAYLPGAALFALPALAWYVPSLAFSLTTAGAPVVRCAAFGVALGLLALTNVRADERAPWLARRAPAFRLPPAGTPGPGAFGGELDPVRLALFAADAREATPAVRSQGVMAARRARESLESGAAVAFPERLRALVSTFSADVARAEESSTPRSPRHSELLRTVRRDADVVGALLSGSVVDNYRPLLGALVESSVLPDATELSHLGANDAETRSLVEKVRIHCEALAEIAARAGDLDAALTLRDASDVLAAPGTVGADYLAARRAGSGLLRALAGDFVRAKEDLGAAPPKAAERNAAPGLRKGGLGLTLLALGDETEAFRALAEAWSMLGARYREPGMGLTPDDLDYWVLVEIAAARFQLAGKFDPALAPQALRDFVSAAVPPLGAPVPKLPALVFGAEARLAEGRRDEAVRLLRDARGVGVAALGDRFDGPAGRMAWPRYRRRGLERLRDLLTAPHEAGERAEVEAELALL
jgi:hypothetical protein